MQHCPQDQHGELHGHGAESSHCVEAGGDTLFTAEDERVHPAPLLARSPEQFVRTCPGRLQRQTRAGHERSVRGDRQSHSQCGEQEGRPARGRRQENCMCFF